MKAYVVSAMAVMLACGTAHAAIVVDSDLPVASEDSATWTPKSQGPFTVEAGDEIAFHESGRHGSLGGYIDTITLTAVPEPGTWALLFTGFVAIGSVLRRRRNVAVSFA